MKILLAISLAGVVFAIVSGKRFSGLGAIALLTAWLVIRGIQVGRVPGIGMAESLLVFAFALQVAGNIVSPKTFEGKAVFLLSGLTLIGVISLPGKHFAIRPLMPALDSPWFLIHVPLFFAGYAALCVDAARAVRGRIEPQFILSSTFIALGIISGGIWAHIAWGNAWGWDPKETWALVTFLVIIAGIHSESRMGKRIAAIAAFACMVFTFLGIAFLFRGLHSYQ